jgi:exo-1,4-beta-D-glucosaminidase
MLRPRFLVVVGLFIISSLATAAAQSGREEASQLRLQQNWFIQPSSQVRADNARADGIAISTVGFSTREWYPATLPSTVLSALVEDKVYPDPYIGTNLRSVPGTTYPIFEDFSNIKMPPNSPFRQSWWFRTEFKLPAEYTGKTIWLGFDGINYRANVWMNGVQVASSEELAGTWRLFQFDVTSAAKAGELNSLAVEVFPPQPRDLAITLVDWAPMPADKEMGIWRDVHITATGTVTLRYPAVLTRLNLPSTDRATLVVRAELTNAADHPVEAVVKGRIEDTAFEQPVHLGAKETQVVRFTREKFSQLSLSNPRLWWPAQVGKQEL